MLKKLLQGNVLRLCKNFLAKSFQFGGNLAIIAPTWKTSGRTIFKIRSLLTKTWSSWICSRIGLLSTILKSRYFETKYLFVPSSSALYLNSNYSQSSLGDLISV